jgi:protein phosphatase
MRWEQPVQYASLSDIGFRRRMNQDTCVVQICSDPGAWRQHGHLFLVADGMGGHAVGELASKIAGDTIPHSFYKAKNRSRAEALREAVEAANAAIHQRGTLNRDFERMGTTCSALVLSPEGALIGHVGDSRVYRIRGERIDQLTCDHSLQWELLRQGRMKPEDVLLYEPRNVITRSLGPEAAVQVDLEGPFPVWPGDVYVLCSDGLTGHVSDAEIGSIARELPPADACRLLVNLANLRGGSDNITAIVVRIGPVPAGLPPEASDTGPPYSVLNWWWYGTFWVVSLILVAGISVGLFGDWVTGLLLIAVALFSLVALFTLLREKRHRYVSSLDPEKTVYWKPYRTASARLNHRFVTTLATLEADLQRTATEEGWTIEEPRHNEAYERAKAALAARHYREALAAYARAIDAQMAGVLLYRRQLKREPRREKPSAAPEK